MDGKGKVKKYALQSLIYLRNASKFIDAGDSEKASEFLWGSMAQAIKAVVAAKGVTFRKHRLLWEYAEILSKELEDKSIYDSFVHAYSLHSNFYESDLELKDVRRMAEDVKTTVGKLLRLIPEEEPTEGSDYG